MVYLALKTREIPKGFPGHVSYHHDFLFGQLSGRGPRSFLSPEVPSPFKRFYAQNFEVVLRPDNFFLRDDGSSGFLLRFTRGCFRGLCFPTFEIGRFPPRPC